MDQNLDNVAPWVIMQHERQVIRDALLGEQSVWLEEAENAETLTQRTIARVIADAFKQSADKFKETKTKEWTNDDDVELPI